jgi:hypothetical protein
MLKMISDMSDRMVGKVTNIVGKINGKVVDLTQIVNSHSQSIAKLEAQVGQIANTLNKREERKLQSQPVINPKGQCGRRNHFSSRASSSYYHIAKWKIGRQSCGRKEEGAT